MPKPGQEKILTPLEVEKLFKNYIDDYFQQIAPLEHKLKITLIAKANLNSNVKAHNLQNNEADLIFHNLDKTQFRLLVELKEKIADTNGDLNDAILHLQRICLDKNVPLEDTLSVLTKVRAEIDRFRPYDECDAQVKESTKICKDSLLLTVDMLCINSHYAKLSNRNIEFASQDQGLLNSLKCLPSSFNSLHSLKLFSSLYLAKKIYAFRREKQEEKNIDKMIDSLKAKLMTGVFSSCDPELYYDKHLAYIASVQNDQPEKDKCMKIILEKTIQLNKKGINPSALLVYEMLVNYFNEELNSFSRKGNDENEISLISEQNMPRVREITETLFALIESIYKKSILAIKSEFTNSFITLLDYAVVIMDNQGELYAKKAEVLGNVMKVTKTDSKSSVASKIIDATGDYFITSCRVRIMSKMLENIVSQLPFQNKENLISLRDNGDGKTIADRYIKASDLNLIQPMYKTANRSIEEDPKLHATHKKMASYLNIKKGKLNKKKNTHSYEAIDIQSDVSSISASQITNELENLGRDCIDASITKKSFVTRCNNLLSKIDKFKIGIEDYLPSTVVSDILKWRDKTIVINAIGIYAKRVDFGLESLSNDKELTSHLKKSLQVITNSPKDILLEYRFFIPYLTKYIYSNNENEETTELKALANKSIISQNACIIKEWQKDFNSEILYLITNYHIFNSAKLSVEKEEVIKKIVSIYQTIDPNNAEEKIITSTLLSAFFVLIDYYTAEAEIALNKKSSDHNNNDSKQNAFMDKFMEFSLKQNELIDITFKKLTTIPQDDDELRNIKCFFIEKVDLIIMNRTRIASQIKSQQITKNIDISNSHNADNDIVAIKATLKFLNIIDSLFKISYEHIQKIEHILQTLPNKVELRKKILSFGSDIQNLHLEEYTREMDSRIEGLNRGIKYLEKSKIEAEKNCTSLIISEEKKEAEFKKRNELEAEKRMTSESSSDSLSPSTPNNNPIKQNYFEDYDVALKLMKSDTYVYNDIKERLQNSYDLAYEENDYKHMAIVNFAFARLEGKCLSKYLPDKSCLGPKRIQIDLTIDKTINALAEFKRLGMMSDAEECNNYLGKIYCEKAEHFFSLFMTHSVIELGVAMNTCKDSYAQVLKLGEEMNDNELIAKANSGYTDCYMLEASHMPVSDRLFESRLEAYRSAKDLISSAIYCAKTSLEYTSRIVESKEFDNKAKIELADSTLISIQSAKSSLKSLCKRIYSWEEWYYDARDKAMERLGQDWFKNDVNHQSRMSILFKNVTYSASEFHCLQNEMKEIFDKTSTMCIKASSENNSCNSNRKTWVEKTSQSSGVAKELS